MIDTIILRLKHPDFQIQNYDAFTPSCLGFFAHPYTPFNGATNLKSTQNASKWDKQNGNYKPRLTLIKRLRREGQFEIELKIELSLPKLMFGNNFRELQEGDFESVLHTLQEKLEAMFVRIDINTLKVADVATVHYSKNFCFTDHTTASSLISDISKVDLTRRLDLNKTDFRNDGKALYYYAQSHSLVFYDKIQDLKQSEARASEQDNTFNLQSNIFEEIRRQKQVPLEVLRMEVRLCSRVKMKQLFKSLNLLVDLNFRDLFSDKVARTVLLDYWEKIFETARQNALLSREPEDLLAAVFKLPDLTLQKAMTIFAYLELSKNLSERAIHNHISERFCPRSFQRLKKLVRTDSDKVIYNRHTAFDRIKSDLLAFDPVIGVHLKTINTDL